ncbi:MAG: lipopolysaccharide heptosyltransferase II [Nitrospira sp.]|nr:lipopolysaccharide heptosyltransferase II [Nitrospira sp.]
MATPVYSCLRSSFPEAKIVCVIRRYALGVISDSPWFDEIIACDDRGSAGFFELLMKLRSVKPDITVLLRNSFGSALLARLGGSGKVYGYKRDSRSLLLTDGPLPEKNDSGFVPVAMADYYLGLCRFMNLPIPADTRPSLYISPELQEAGKRLHLKYGIRPDELIVGFNPGAKFGTSKCWSPENFAKVAELFQEKWGCRIMLFAGPGEDEIAETITRTSKADIINTAPDRVDLRLLKYLVQRCGLLVTNDTGTRHYAVAFDIPVVVIMGPTDAAYTAASLQKTSVIQKKLACVPCHKKQCPEGHHDCMEMITPEEVFEESCLLMEKLKTV